VAGNLAEFLRSGPHHEAGDSKLAVAWGANFGGFGDRIRDSSRSKQAPLPQE